MMRRLEEYFSKTSMIISVREFCLAGVFLTRLPFSISKKVKDGELAESSWAFPLVGVLVGLIGGIVYLAVNKCNLNSLICAGLSIFVITIVTGAIHEDGLADTIDGLGGGGDRHQKLKIMRDSFIGSYGVLSLIFSVIFRWLGLAQFSGPETAVVGLVISGSMSRSILPIIPCFFRSARNDGLGFDLGKPSMRVALTSLLFGAIFCVIFLGLIDAILIIGVLLVVTVIFLLLVCRQIGGYTGDVLGACQQIGEIIILVLVWLSIS